MTEESLFELAVNTPEAERPALLDRACGGDAALRARLDALLSAHLAVGGWLDLPHGAIRTHPDRPAPPAAGAGAVVAGRYKLLQRIGEGGMGAVWMAQQTEPVRRLVAVKLIRAERGDSGVILARFEAERQAIALMDHPHIAKLLDAGTTEGGAPYFVMELVKGVPLNEFCDRGRLSVPERLRLFLQVCAAVQHAHQKGVIHRDLKPTNILVESHDGRPVPKVIDFGLAKATDGMSLTERTVFTAFGSVMGTPLYMAPEQATFNAVDVDTRADVYALGVLLYELLTGTTPLLPDSMKKAGFDEVLRLVREQEAPPPSSRVSKSEARPALAASRQTEPERLGRLVKGELDWVVLKALSKERERRYETASALARDVERFLNHEPVSAGPPTAAYRLRKFVQRNKAQVVAAGLVLLALLAGMAGTAWGLVRAEQRRAEAEEARQAEAERAEGERQARVEEARQRGLAEAGLAYARKFNELLGSVFAGLDPKRIAASGRPLQDVLRENLGRAVRELEGKPIGDELAVANMQATLGESLLGLGDYAQAVILLEKAYRTRRAKLGPDHPNTLTSMSNLAVGYQETGKLELALPLYEEAMRRTKAKQGADHPDALRSMNNLAEGYRAAGKLDRALPLHEEALRICKASLGRDHPLTLTSMNNLASGYRDAEQPDRALPLLEETLELSKAKLGLDHPNTLQSINNLASGYRDAGRLDRALPLYDEALRLRRAKLGPDHPHTLASMSNLASCCFDAGRLDWAVPLHEQALRLTKARLGLDHPHTLRCMNDLAAAYWAARQLDRSVPLFEEALKGREGKLGRDHPDTLLTAANLGVNYKDAGRLAEAIPLLEEGYRAAGKHPRLRWVGAALLDGYLKAGKAAEAARLLDELVADARRRLPRSSPQLAGQLATFGLVLLLAGEFAQAERLLRECFAIRERAQPDAWPTFNTMSMLGGVLLSQKKYADAEPLLLRGYEGMKSREKAIPPKGGTRIPEALDRLVELYAATDRPGLAAKYRAERKKYPAGKPTPPVMK